MSELTDKVVRIATPFLGPAARRFLEQQSKVHKLAFETLEHKQLPELSRWVGTAAAQLIDKQKADLLAAQIMRMWLA